MTPGDQSAGHESGLLHHRIRGQHSSSTYLRSNAGRQVAVPLHLGSPMPCLTGQARRRLLHRFLQVQQFRQNMFLEESQAASEQARKTRTKYCPPYRKSVADGDTVLFPEAAQRFFGDAAKRRFVCKRPVASRPYGPGVVFLNCSNGSGILQVRVRSELAVLPASQTACGTDPEAAVARAE